VVAGRSPLSGHVVARRSAARHELRSSQDGRLVCRLEQADAGRSVAKRGGRWPERFAAKGRDGVTDIYGIIIRPRNFESAKKYPVVENIYAGPPGFLHAKSFRTRYEHQQRSRRLGPDRRAVRRHGTSGRSKKFHDIAGRTCAMPAFRPHCLDPGRRGQVSEMDLSRVGIYGGSAGGQNAMAALLWHGDFYHVAVADCGCHDNRMDKICGTSSGWAGPSASSTSSTQRRPCGSTAGQANAGRRRVGSKRRSGLDDASGECVGEGRQGF